MSGNSNGPSFPPSLGGEICVAKPSAELLDIFEHTEFGQRKFQPQARRNVQRHARICTHLCHFNICKLPGFRNTFPTKHACTGLGAADVGLPFHDCLETYGSAILQQAWYAASSVSQLLFVLIPLPQRRGLERSLSWIWSAPFSNSLSNDDNTLCLRRNAPTVPSLRSRQAR